MNKKNTSKNKRYYTSFVEADERTLEKLFGTKSQKNETQEPNEQEDEFGKKEETKAELRQTIKILLTMLRWAIFICIFGLNLALSISLAANSDLSSKTGVIFVVLSVLSLYFAWFTVKIKKKNEFQKKLKNRMLVTLLFSLGTCSYKWFFYMLLMMAFNFFAILGYAFFFNNFKIKRSAKKEELQRIIEVLIVVFVLLVFVFSAKN